MSTKEFNYKWNEEYLINWEMKTNQIGIIIHEYIEQNNIKPITEEELTDIFGIETLYPNVNMPMSEWTDTSWWTVLEWQEYQMASGICSNVCSDGTAFTDSEFDPVELEQLSEDDQFNDDRDNYYNDLIDKYYGTSIRNDKQYAIFNKTKDDEDYFNVNNDYIDEFEWGNELQQEYDYVILQDRQRFVEIIEGDITFIAGLTERDGKVYAFIHDFYGTEFEKKLQDEQDAEYINEDEWEKELQEEIELATCFCEPASSIERIIFPEKYDAYALQSYPLRWLDDIELKEKLYGYIQASDIDEGPLWLEKNYIENITVYKNE